MSKTITVDSKGIKAGNGKDIRRDVGQAAPVDNTYRNTGLRRTAVSALRRSKA